MRYLLLLLLVCFTLACGDDDTGGADAAQTDRGALEAGAPDQGPAPDRAGPACEAKKCAMTMCGICSCSWTCGQTIYQIKCESAPTAPCTCNKDGVKVGTCTAPYGPDSAACKANCCKFPQP